MRRGQGTRKRHRRRNRQLRAAQMKPKLQTRRDKILANQILTGPHAGATFGELIARHPDYVARLATGRGVSITTRNIAREALRLAWPS